MHFPLYHAVFLLTPTFVEYPGISLKITLDSCLKGKLWHSDGMASNIIGPITKRELPFLMEMQCN